MKVRHHTTCLLHLQLLSDAPTTEPDEGAGCTAVQAEAGWRLCALVVFCKRNECRRNKTK